MAYSRHIRRSFSWACLLLLLALPLAAQTVSMVPHVAVPDTSVFSVYVYLDSDLQDVQGVEIAMTFDNTIVRLDGIDEGDWFSDSGLEHFFFDYTTAGTDTIHFTGALLHEGRTADGVLGICNFTALAVGVSPVDFVDVDVRDSDNVDLEAAHSSGDQIIIEAAIAAESLGFGDVKRLYR